jgi:hypothetical protein
VILSYRGVRIALLVLFPSTIASIGVSAQTMTPQQRLQQTKNEIDKFLLDNDQGTPGVSGAVSDLSGPPTFNDLFQTRNPRVCAKVTTVPNAAQAAVLVQCEREASSILTGFNPVLFLVTDVTLEIGKLRGYIQTLDLGQNIYVTAKVYPLRFGYRMDLQVCPRQYAISELQP